MSTRIGLCLSMSCSGLLRALTVALVAAVLSAAAGSARAQEAACSALLARVQETATGSQALSSDIASANWQTSARCLIDYLGQMESGTVLSPAGISQLRVVAGALRAIIEVNPKEFRGVLTGASTYDSTRSLVLAAASSDKILRLNASFVLANIIDPKITCVVVDHLANPDLGKTESGRNGRANLLGILRAMANWADPYTRALIRDALEISSARIAGQSNVQTTSALIDDVRTRLNNPIRNAAQVSENCRGFTPQFSKPSFDRALKLGEAVARSLSSDVPTARAAVASLLEMGRDGGGSFASTAQEALWPLTRSTRSEVNDLARRSVQRAYCYQESSTSRDSQGRYLVVCHPTKELCERTRGPNTRDSVKQTACALVEREAGFGDLQGGGFDGALYLYSPDLFQSPPFPSVDQ